MKILKRLLLGILSLALLLVAVSLFLPSEIEVARDIVVEAPAEIPFKYVNDLRKNEDWSAWKAMDSTAVWTYGPTSEGVGGWYEWKGDKTGSGRLTITESLPHQSVRVALDFHSMGQGEATYTFEPVAEGVRVTESFYQDVGWSLGGRWFGLFADKMLGGAFEQGLAALKQVSETQAKAQAEAEAEAEAMTPDEVATIPQPATP